ncbi:MAG: hypothetical protein F6K35_34325, partial [Okeania sp. SIO2H7]|nr:hypothetical protein [Okeania sp. SIO2H7]
YTIEQNQPYYNNLNPNSGINTPQNQPYYSDINGNNYGQTPPPQLNYPNQVPVGPNNTNLPNNPYSRTGYPYSGNSPYSTNQSYPQFQQNKLYNGTNYYQGNYGATQQPQPYNNSPSNPFNKRFGEENNPFNNR